ncbi:MAG: hypothetical protein WBB34_01565 [Xanthobacteraceae bacterium]
MIFFLTSHSLWLSGVLLIGLGTALSMLGPIVVRRHVTLERLTANNEIAGFKYAVLGVLYAVLLAFAIIVVWQKFSDAEASVVQEAGAATTIYRLSQGMGDQAGADLRAAVTAYLEAAIKDDWPAMGRGTPQQSPAGRKALNAIYATLLKSNASQNTGNPVLAEVLHQLDQMTQARRTRLIASEGAVPGVIWLVLFGGAIITIGFTFFFGTRNLPVQVLMTGLLSLIIFAELLTIVAIDRPFTGPVKVEPRALMDVLADFQGENETH